ncbi:MAG TPA: glycosyltransferase family 1 protein [Candidatus Limnocylindrales bacterium]
MLSKQVALGRPRTSVLFDAHQLGRRQTGNETYVRELLRALRARDDLDLVAAVEAGQLPTGLLGSPVRTRRVPSNGVGRLVALSAIARRERADLVHAIYFLPPRTGRPTIVTVHDVSFELYPEFFSRRALLRDRFLIRASARAATRVVTGSEAARQDLLRLYGLEPQRVVAIPYGVDPGFRPSDEAWAPYAGDRPLRVLAVGTLQPRKNLLRLLDALAIVGRDIPVELRVVGPDGHQAAEIRAYLAASVRTEVVGWMGDEELASAYRRADVFAYPSIYEGFGLPVIEAMASGTPVVTSTGGSIPEVAGDAALLVDPFDTAALAAAIRRVVEDASVARGLRERGLARASTFTWERSAALHANLYREVVGR